MKKVLSLMLAGIALLANQSHSVTFFADDFEAAGAAGATKIGAPWVMNKEVFSPSGTFLGGYNPNVTFGPNAIAAGGAGGSAWSGKVWPDYDYEPDWRGSWGAAPNLTGNRQAIGLLVSKVGLTAEDIAPGVIQFDFDYLRDNPVGPNAQAYAFVKLLSPTWETWATNVFNLAASGDWLHGSAKMTFDGTQVGANLQWGIVVSDVNYGGGAGVQIDNVTVSNVPEPTSASLLGLGLAGLLASRLRRRS